MGSFAKAGWNLWHSGNRMWGLGNGLCLANRYRPRKGHCCPPQDIVQANRGGLNLFFTFSRDAARKNVLGAWEASLKRGRSCGIWERALHKGHHRPPHKGHLRLPHKVKVLMLRIVQFVNGLRPSMGFS